MIKEFTLGATKWTVKAVEEINKGNTLGETTMSQTAIEIAQTCNNGDVSKQSKEQTINHEVVHAILDTMGEYDLSGNEKFVQGFSVLMQQFEKTKK